MHASLHEDACESVYKVRECSSECSRKQECKSMHVFMRVSAFKSEC